MDKNIALPRFCKYKFCRTLLPKGSQKKYCKETDCYKKQNRIEMKERRDKLKANKPKKFRKCNFDECGKRFEVKPKSPNKYCNEECRDAKYRKAHAKRWEQTQTKIIVKREERIKAEEKIDKRYTVQNGNIDSKYTTRGKIHYEGLSL